MIKFLFNSKKIEIVKFAWKWLELENILPSVVESGPDKCHIICLICRF